MSAVIQIHSKLNERISLNRMQFDENGRANLYYMILSWAFYYIMCFTVFSMFCVLYIQCQLKKNRNLGLTQIISQQQKDIAKLCTIA